MMSVSGSDFSPRIKGRLKGFTLLAVMALTTLAAVDSCSAEAGSLQAAAESFGASKVKSVAFAGTGSWYQFGQAPSPTTVWPKFDVSSYSANINYETAAAHVQITRKQTIEAGRVRPAPVEQKADQYVTGASAWNIGGNPAAVQFQPAAVEERAAEIWTTPQGFLRAAIANNAASKNNNGSIEVSFNQGKYRYVGTINNQNQVVSVQTWIDNPILGDTAYETSYSDYKVFNGVNFPAHIVRKLGGYPVLDLNVASVSINAETNISVPPEVSNAGAPKINVTADQLAPGVFYLKGGTHHSVAIEQKDHVVLVEAPLNEARSEALIAKIKEIIPNKPITTLINTHQHFDHSGGLRTFVDAGATIVTQQLNKPYYEKVWGAPHTINPDNLAKSQKTAKFQTFTDNWILTDGRRFIEIYQIAGSGHNDAFALVYLPGEKILIEADAFTPTAVGAPLPSPVNPYTVNLYDNIKRLNLDVQQIAALHGPRVTTLADLKAAIGRANIAGN